MSNKRVPISHCQKCGRPLYTLDSFNRGMGSTCAGARGGRKWDTSLNGNWEQMTLFDTETHDQEKSGLTETESSQSSSG